MPYIYSEAWKVTNDASIIMRPLVYDFPANNNTHEISDQFMFGSAMMICPVTTFQARTREVYLPEGLWYDFQTNAKLEGGKYHTISAPLDQIPIFIRAGAIIPMGPEIQFALQKTDEPIELYVYEGKDGSFTLYQDDGETYDYEQGEFSSIELKYLHKENKIVFEEDSGDFFDYETESLNFRIITVPGGVTIDVPYTGKRTVLGTK